ncbi:MAG TPA: hypothetical protein VLJ17_07920 [Xanthobacteraceae bacterium]|nr:hypothetical protein [Xanthobacteraceae bacterium]
MFYLAGAAACVLDILGSLQGGTGTQQNGTVSATTSSQSPFNIPAYPTDSGTTVGATATSPNPAGNSGGCWSCAETMSTLLSEQSQSTSATADTVANRLGTIEQLLNRIGAGNGIGGFDGSLDSTQNTDGPHKHSFGGVEQLLQSLESPFGAGASTSPDALTAPDAGFSSSFPFSWPSGGAPGAVASGLGDLGVNPLGRLINLQSRMLAAATAGRNLSTTA